MIIIQAHYQGKIQHKGLTVPMETPQSMLEEPSNGSKTTQYLHY